MNLSPEKKIAGVLAPLFALRGEEDLGIGDVATLREFIDWVAGIGFKLVQLLPVNETGADNSPYNAISAMAIEPTTLHLAPDSPQDLTREDFDDLIADVDPNSLRLGTVKYRAVKKLKRRLLEKAFASFSGHASEERQVEFRTFCEEESAWLRDYAFFRVLMEGNEDSAAWNRWPAQHQTIETARSWLRDLPHDRQAALRHRESFFCYVQWIANQQWRAVKLYAEERGVALMGDIPFDHNQMLQQTGGRAPHFVPRDDETPQNREANKREGEEYLRVVLEEAGGRRVVGEDLGVVPDYVRPNLRSLGIAGFKIPQWEGRDGMIIPGDKYERLSVATYATHDHEPIRALWSEALEHLASNAGEQARATLEKIALFARVNPKIDELDFEKDFYPAIMEALFRCESWIAMVMITDLLARKYRFNVPGTKANLNWTRRMRRSIAQLRSSRKEQKQIGRASCRERV